MVYMPVVAAWAGTTPLTMTPPPAIAAPTPDREKK